MRAIPKSFELLGHTIKVVWKETPRNEAGDKCDGLWDINKLTIFLDSKQLPTMKRHSFWHEVGHAILDLCGYTQLSENEDLVDTLGGALAQIDATRTNK